MHNIYKELITDIPQFVYPKHGYLKSWADQGILLLNTFLSVESGKAHSHAHFGWEIFTDKVIDIINTQRNRVVFLLWGIHAQKKESKIDSSRHYILKASHPSPFSAYRGFIGCQHFSKTNTYLIQNGMSAIDWNLKLHKK